MIRHWKSAAAVFAFATVAGASDAAAQVGISLGAGPSFPVGALADEFDLGFNVQASAGFTPAILPFGVRVDGAFNRFPEDGGHLRVISGSLNALFNLTVPGIVPYVIGGLGVYNSLVSHDDEEDHGGGHDSVTNLGANIGAGVQLGIGGLSVFGETRFHNVFSEGDHLRFVPLTIGIRF
jgi:hypothetical protein